MEKFTVLRGVAAPLLRTNIDTGTIIASVWMRSRAFDLGEKLFANWRYAADGSEQPDFVLNQPRYRQSRILISGPLFGCGSSREAAVWALMRFGIRCVIAPSFGEIFFDNALQNGLLPIVLTEAETHSLAATVESAATPELTIELKQRRVIDCDGREIPFAISAERQIALLDGLDDTSLILRYEAEIDAFRAADARARPWLYLRAAASQGTRER
jgi:3-isopropylmalate/(R)-2-methylmalate dehydratase small subunit